MQNQAEEDTETGLLEVHQQHVFFSADSGDKNRQVWTWSSADQPTDPAERGEDPDQLLLPSALPGQVRLPANQGPPAQTFPFLQTFLWFFSSLFLHSSLHFQGIYLQRCFMCHLTGSVRLTDTCQT